MKGGVAEATPPFFHIVGAKGFDLEMAPWSRRNIPPKPVASAVRSTGKIDLEEDNVSHLEQEEQKYHRIMARQ